MPSPRKPPQAALQDSILNAWKTNNRATVFLVEHLSPELWEARIPGAPRRTIRMLAAHLHNTRCAWTRTLGREHGITAPPRVDRYTVTPKQLISALQQSSAGVASLLHFGCDQGGSIPGSASYVWRNLPLDVGHVFGYLVAHEAHHRGQIIMLARQLEHRLPPAVTDGIWNWSKFSKES